MQDAKQKQTTENRTSCKRRVLHGFLCFTTLAWGLYMLSFWQSSRWLDYGDRAMQQGKKREAFNAWHAAGSWQAPFIDWNEVALSRLAESRDPSAQRRLRGAILESSLFLSPREKDWIKSSAEKLAATRPDLPPSLWTDVPARFSLWKMLASFATLALMLSGYGLIAAFTRSSARRRTLTYLGLSLLSLACLLLGLFLAGV